MKNRQIVLQTLASLDIPYRLVEHDPVHTIADCLAVPGIDWQTTDIARNAFLCNRQQTAFYLMLLRHDVPFRTAVVSKALGVSRLSFAPDALLPELLGLEAGAVSPLGLLFDPAGRVSLVLDEGLAAYEYLAMHPCDNTATVILRREDFMDVFLPHTKHEPHWVKAKEEEA